MIKTETAMLFCLKLRRPRRLKANESLRLLIHQKRLMAAAESSSACSRDIHRHAPQK